MGEQFWRSLAYTVLDDKTCRYPYVRASLLVANATGRIVEDGIAKTTTKTDVESVASKANNNAASAAEDVLKKAFELVKAVSSVELCIKPLGSLLSRMGLAIAKAEEREAY